MDPVLILLYNRFYTPLPMTESEQEIEACHQQLIERLEKPERTGAADHGCPESNDRGALREQAPLRAQAGGELAYELNHLEPVRNYFPAEEGEEDV